MSDLLDAKAVASRLGISETQVKRRTKAEGWPSVRFSTKTIRYREEHVEQIIALHELTGERSTAPSLGGQTARSRRRAS